MTEEQKYIGGAFLIGIAYRLLMGLQGIDNVDMGFCMTFYQNIFTHPDAMPFYFNYYLTGLIGGVWHLLFGQFGLLGFRLLETMTMALAIWLLFLAFRPWLSSPRISAVAILLSFLFPSLIVTFHYDTLSFLLMAASVYASSRYLRGNALLWLTVAGAMIGISFFARIVNGVLAALVFFPLLWGWRKSSRDGFVAASYYAGGILAGCLLVLSLMGLLGHLPYFGEALAEAFGTFSGHETSHASANLFGVYLKSYVNIGLQILVVALLALYFGDAGHLSAKLRTVLRIIMLVALFVLVLTSQPYLSAVAICTLMIVITPHPLPLLFYALACAYLFPFGSDIGIPGIFHWCGGLLIVPAAYCYKKLTSQWQRTVTGLLGLAVALNMVYKMGATAYGEDYPRSETFTQALSGTLNTMTDADRAVRYRNEVARIRQYAAGNNLLLIANQASELYYATGLLPFTGNTQMGTYMGETLVQRLDSQHERYGRLPLIAFIKRGHDTDDMDEFRQTLHPWMVRQGYHTVYDDDDIELFVTENP